MISSVVAKSSHIHKDGREHHKDQALDHTNKELEGVERHRRNNWDKEGHDCDENLTCEDVTKETEGKRDDLRELRD